MADDYAWDTDHFVVCNGTTESPRNFTDLNTWAQGQGGAPAAAITEFIAGAMYKLDADVDIGNGSDTTYFTSKNEMVYFADNTQPDVKSEATLKLGELVNGYPVNGSMWSLGQAGDWYIQTGPASIFLMYASTLKNRMASRVIFQQGTCDIRNSILCGNFDGVNTSRYDFTDGLSSLQLIDVFITNTRYVYFGLLLTAESKNIWIHRTSQSPLVVENDILLVGFNVTDADTYDLALSGTADNVTLRDPLFIPSSIRIDTADHYTTVQFTCNIHVTDKVGANLSGVTVTCKDQYNTEVFSVATDANGDIAEQNINYRRWTGTSEVETTYSPHVFTFSKAGHRTLTIDSFTVDHPLVWELKLLDAVAFSNFAENAILDHITGRTSFTMPTVYIGLCTADPGEAATGASCHELPNTDGYARVATSESDWNAASSGSIDNANAFTFPVSTGDWGAITHYVLLDSGTYGEGNVITYDKLDVARTVISGEIVNFAAGSLTLELD